MSIRLEIVLFSNYSMKIYGCTDLPCTVILKKTDIVQPYVVYKGDVSSVEGLTKFIEQSSTATFVSTWKFFDIKRGYFMFQNFTHLIQRVYKCSYFFWGGGDMGIGYLLVEK